MCYSVCTACRVRHVQLAMLSRGRKTGLTGKEGTNLQQKNQAYVSENSYRACH